MGLAFVPLYIRYLGIEAYGLIGIFALLQVWLGLLDMGMKPALSREMARFTAGAHNAQSIRDLLRSVELIAIAIAGVVAVGIWAASPWLASNWLKAGSLPLGTVAQAITVMGAVTGLRFIEDIYVSSIVGLQRQVMQNIVTSVMATARGLGAVCLLAWFSPTIRAFFLWQGLISLMTVAVFAGFIHRALPHAPLPARFSRPALMGIWRFAASMMVLTVLSMLLTQVDKLLLSRLLTLKAYGYYALAAVVANGLYVLVAPITAAFYPRFTELVARGDEVASRAAYHQGAQLVTAFMGAAAVVLIVFHDKVILLWTNDPVLVRHVATLMAVLALGTLFNGLVWIPYQLQLAHGWTSLMMKFDIVAVSLVVPAIVLVTPAYGAIGAAWVWVTLNAAFIIFAVPLMHRRLLPGEQWRWYRQDVAVPLGAAMMAAFFCRFLIPDHLGRIAEFGALLVTAGCVLLAAVLAAPEVRNQLLLHLPSTIRQLLAPITRQTHALGQASSSPR
jgi:O-antigen/teichoic acid export membrane protein